MQWKCLRFLHAWSQRSTLAGVDETWPPRRTQHAHAMSANEGSWPSSHIEQPSALLSERSTAARSLLPPSASWKKAVSTQLSDCVATIGSFGSEPSSRKRKRATLASPSMGHILGVLNFICTFGTGWKERSHTHTLTLNNNTEK